jgi:hypothetical protein
MPISYLSIYLYICLSINNATQVACIAEVLRLRDEPHPIRPWAGGGGVPASTSPYLSVSGAANG